MADKIKTLQIKKNAVGYKFQIHNAFKIDAEENNFEYSISLNGVRVSFIDVNGTQFTEKIKASAKFFAELDKPFYIEVRAVLISPGGSGTFQLKNLATDKNVFDKPQPFEFDDARGGLFLKNVKI